MAFIVVADRGTHVRGFKGGKFHVAVGIDKAGRQREARGVDNRVVHSCRQGTDLRNDTVFHAADIFCGVPKCVVLCADKKQLAADILDLYEFLLGNRCLLYTSHFIMGGSCHN